MARCTKSRASATACSRGRPRARPAATAADRVHPVPWVDAVAMRGRVKRRAAPCHDEHVHDLLARQVAPFDERGTGTLRHDVPSCPFHLIRRRDVPSHQDAGLVEVGRDEGGERHEPLGDEALGVAVEQPVARRRDHDRIEHVLRQAALRDAGGHRVHQLRRSEHARLDRRRREIVGDGVDLLADQGPRQRGPAPHAERVLGRDGADYARAEHPELVERLEVGLDAGTPARVRAGDREGDLHLAPGSAGASFRGAAIGRRNRRFRIASNLQSTVRDLQRRKARGRRGLALIEGVRLVEEVLTAKLPLKGALISTSFERTARGKELVTQLADHACPVEEVSERTFAQLADTDAPQGIIAVVEPRRWKADQIPLDPRSVLLVVDGVQDPGNVGTLLRTAHALGAAATIVLRGTADLLSPKALRSAMGATFRHPYVTLEDAAFITWARAHDVTLWASAADGVPLHQALAKRKTKESGPIAVIVGNEGAGIRPQLNAVSAQRVAIPLAQGAESLNVAVAAGILLYEVRRGR